MALEQAQSFTRPLYTLATLESLQLPVSQSLLSRAIKFRKSRYVDDKLEMFKRKYAPVNSTTGVVHKAEFSYADQKNANNVVGGVDANGFDQPGKALFSKDSLELGWKDIRPVGSGLIDLGKVSALNSVLQILTYTPILANYLLSRRHSANCTVQDYCFVCAIEKLVRQSLGTGNDLVSSREFIGKLKKMNKGTSDDASSIWNYFMEQMQSFFLLEKGSTDQRTQETTALYQMFGGYLQNNIKCGECNKTENKYDATLYFDLDISQNNTVDRCLSRMMKETTSKIHCTSCDKECTGQIKRSVYRTPSVLAIHLDRFENSSEGKKNPKAVKFQDTLDIERNVTESERGSVKAKYNLYGVIVHEGPSRISGKFVSYVKSSNGIWYCMDNESVQQVSTKRLFAQQAYMLFYTHPAERTQSREVKTEEPTSTTKAFGEGELEEAVVEENEQPLQGIEEDEEEQKLKEAIEAAASKPKVENTEAIVVQHNDNLQSKREKLDALIERENAIGKSDTVKQELIVSSSNSQFFEDVSRWDEDLGATVTEEGRKKALRAVKSKRKKTDMYDMDYDRGKVKKVKNKQMDKFGKPNLFQAAAEEEQKGKKKKRS
ncbi:hypothetical protein CLU79DRAFT_765665 [Phycomyces nitens]|nr:hypothetical protein CLU79DRAFT_765665 [Phycomyces nitens]